MKNKKYIIFKYKSRNIISIPYYNKIIRNNGYKFYLGSTIRKKIIRIIIRLLTKFRLEYIISYQSETPIPNHKNFEFETWLDKIKDDLNVHNLYAVVNFPSQIYRHRVYVNLLNEYGNSVAFAKLSLDDKNNIDLLNESKNIHELNKNRFSFSMPNILIHDSFCGCEYLIFESFPIDSLLKDGKWETFKFYSNELYKYINEVKCISNLSWWDDFLNNATIKNKEFFLDDISLLNNNLIETCLVHGDLHRGNTCLIENKVLLFDWESSCIDAPIMTDEIVFFLAEHQRMVSYNPKKVAIKIREHFIKGKDKITKLNVGMALAFLSTTKRQDAKDMIYYWKYIIN